eukprot:6019591-Amphidinium_carterae.1
MFDRFLTESILNFWDEQFRNETENQVKLVCKLLARSGSGQSNADTPQPPCRTSQYTTRGSDL